MCSDNEPTVESIIETIYDWMDSYLETAEKSIESEQPLKRGHAKVISVMRRSIWIWLDSVNMDPLRKLASIVALFEHESYVDELDEQIDQIVSEGQEAVIKRAVNIYQNPLS